MKTTFLLTIIFLFLTQSFAQQRRDDVSRSGNINEARLEDRRNGDRQREPEKNEEPKRHEKVEEKVIVNPGEKHNPNRPSPEIDRYPKKVKLVETEIIEVPVVETKFVYTSEKEQGMNLLEVENFQAALEYFNLALEKNKKDLELYYLRGLAETGLEYYEFAIEDFDFYLRFFDDDGEAYYRRGLAKFFNSQKTEAYKDFMLSIEFECDKAKSILKKYY